MKSTVHYILFFVSRNRKYYCHFSFNTHARALPLSAGSLIFVPVSLHIQHAHGHMKGKKPGGTTYADMIAHALGKVEGGRAAFNNICQIIERDFNDGLNWKLER